MNLSLQVIIAAVTGLVGLAAQIKKLWDGSAGFVAIAKVVDASPAVHAIEALGAAVFPNAVKAVQKVLVAIHLGHPDSTRWVQQALNAGMALGFFSFGIPLVVDGAFGPKTMAAVHVLQVKLKIDPANSMVQEAEYAALNLFLTGKLPA